MSAFKPTQYSPIDLVAPAFFVSLLFVPLALPVAYFIAGLINGT